MRRSERATTRTAPGAIPKTSLPISSRSHPGPAPAGRETALLNLVVADDASIIRLDLKETLERLGHRVVGEAGDGQRAVELARQLRPDLVILDIKMPGLDGIDAAQLISQEQLAPVMLLTAFSQQDLVKRAVDAGVFSYVVKPFTEADLLPAIELAIARYREFDAIRREAADVREALQTRKAVDRAKGILMAQHGLSEQEAFRRIQQQSMNSRRSMRQIAEAILIAHEVSGGPAPEPAEKP